MSSCQVLTACQLFFGPGKKILYFVTGIRYKALQIRGNPDSRAPNLNLKFTCKL